MKALVFRAPNLMEFSDWPDPVVGEREALIAVKAVGICGSDIHGYRGESGRRVPPLVMGHEFSGIVEAVGSGGDSSWIGRPVTVQPVIYCGSCDQCRAGSVQRCRSRSLIGGDRNGAMASHVAVPIRNLVALKEPVDFVKATLSEPAAVAYHAIRRASGLEGSVVLVCGGGPIGLLTALLAKESGAGRVVITEPDRSRRVLAERLGVDIAVDPIQDKTEEALRQWTDHGEADIAIEAVGIEATVASAIRQVKPGGEVIILGGWKTLSVAMGPVVSKEVLIKGSFNYLPEEFEHMATWVGTHAEACGLIISHVIPLDRGAEAFRDLVEKPSASMKTVLTIGE